MLSKEVFKQKVKDLIDFYPTWGIKADDKNVVSKWYSKFSKLTDTEFINMVNLHIEKVRFNPTVASLNDFRIEVRQSTLDKSTLGERSSMWND